MGILFTILMVIPFTITMGFLFTIVLGIQLTISSCQSLFASLKKGLASFVVDTGMDSFTAAKFRNALLAS